MRTVMPSREVTHVWASQQQPAGRNGKRTLYFDGPTIYSYGNHWPLAHFLRPDVVIINADTYGNSTSRHASYTRQALPRHVETIHIPECGAVREFLRNSDNPKPLLNSLHGLIGVHLDSAAKRLKPALFHSDISAAQAVVASYDRLADFYEAPRYVLPAYVPTLPPYLRAGDTPFADTAAATMAAFKTAHREARGREQFAEQCTHLRDAWAARRATVIYLGECQATRNELDRLAERYGLTVPRKLPSARTIARELASATDAADIAECSQLATRVANHVGVVQRLYAEFRSVHTSTGVQQLPDHREPLSRNGYNAAHILRSLHTCNWMRGVGTPEFSHDRFERLAPPQLPAKPSPQLRETTDALRALIAAAQQDLAPLYAKMNRARTRELLQIEARSIMWRLRDAEFTGWANLASNINSYRLAYESAEKEGLARGLHHPDRMQELHSAGQTQYKAQRAQEQREERIAFAEQAVAVLRNPPLHLPYTFANALYTAERGRQNLTESVPDHPLVAELGALIALYPDVTAPTSGSPEAVAAWRAGDKAAPPPAGFVFRCIGERIESSQGATVTVAEGLKLWRLIQCGARDFGDNGPRIGYYQLRSIAPDGSAVVGCHHITAEEVQSFGLHMGWTV